MKLIFMGTPEFAVPTLVRMLNDGHEIACVFTQPDKPAGRGNKLQAPPVKLVASARGITVHQPAKIKTNEEIRTIFQETAPEACVVAAYGRILPEWLLGMPKLGCINVHASLLPKYRGAAPINWAIVNGEKQTGITIMQMDAGMDTGPILSQESIAIGPEETAPELAKRLAELGADLLSATLPRVARGDVTPIKQNDSQASYAPILKREHGMIDWALTAREIANRVRGFQPWPGTFTLFRGKHLIILKALEGAPGPAPALTGTITSLDRTGMTVACAASTALQIVELQIEGKRRMTGRDFANGMRLGVGDRITDYQSA
jgi:methionyl-tRNA formyltransferase